MPLSLKRIAVLAVFLTICGTAGSRTMGQKTSASKTPPLKAITYSGDMASLLMQLADSFEVTIGLEVDPQQPRSRVELDLHDADLPDVLNAIVQSAPRYTWREREGFIEMLPLEGRSTLLDTTISKFRARDVDQAAALDQLLNVPELQAVITALKFNRRDVHVTPTKGSIKKFSMSQEGATMRETLGRIGKESGRRFWIFHSYGDGFLISDSSW